MLPSLTLLLLSGWQTVQGKRLCGSNQRTKQPIKILNLEKKEHIAVTWYLAQEKGQNKRVHAKAFTNYECMLPLLCPSSLSASWISHSMKNAMRISLHKFYDTKNNFFLNSLNLKHSYGERFTMLKDAFEKLQVPHSSNLVLNIYISAPHILLKHKKIV